MSVIFMIRHGQASFGHDNYDRLSPTGIEQSRILGTYLASIGLQIDAAYSGTMERQKKTAQEVLSYYTKSGRNMPEPLQIEGLNEYDSKAIVTSLVPDMMDDDPTLMDHLERMFTDKESFKKVFEGAMLRWVSGDHDKPGVETWKEFTSRTSDAIRCIMHRHGKGSNIAVFTSGGPICATLKWVLSLSDEHAMRLNWQIVNTSYSRFMYNEERITLAGFNSIPHLELNKERSLITYR